MWEPDALSGFERLRLANGLEVMNKTYPGCPFVTALIIIKVGARHDPIGKEGLAHFVEHLVLNNIPGYTHRQAKDFFELRGGDVNFGETSYDSTTYKFFSPVDELSIREALHIMGSMLMTVRPSKDIERERRVIVQEITGQVPWLQQVKLRRMRSVYHDLPMSRFFRPAGNTESVARITQDDLQVHYGSCYIPANTRIVMLGGLPTPKLVELLEQSEFGIQQEGTVLNFAPVYYPAESLPESKYECKWTDMLNESFDKGGYETYCALPASLSTPKVATLWLMLGKTLYKELREKRGWSYNYKAQFCTFADLYELGIQATFVSSALKGGLEQVIEDAIESVGTNEELFERCRTILRTDLELLDTSFSGVRNMLGNQLEYRDHLETLSNRVSQYNSMRLQDIAGMLEYLQPQRRWTMLVHP